MSRPPVSPTRDLFYSVRGTRLLDLVIQHVEEAYGKGVVIEDLRLKLETLGGRRAGEGIHLCLVMDLVPAATAGAQP